MADAPAPNTPPPGRERFLRSRAFLVALYLVFLAAYLGAAGGRVRRASQHNHFAYLAEGWLKGRLDLASNPPNENDWVRVEVLTLKDGRTVKGQFSQTGATDRFHPLSGKSMTIDPSEIVSRHWIRYVSFPPLPAALMLPGVAVFGVHFNDVLFNVIWAAVNPLLLYLLLESLRRRGLSSRTSLDNLLLTVLLGAGSVYFYSSVVGQVWYTAHVIGVTLAIAYAWASIEARRPALAGLFLGLGFATRTPMGFMFPLFLVELVRVSGGWGALKGAVRGVFPKGFVRRVLTFAAPAAAVLAVLLVHNFMRFERWTEFGHKYLNIVWQERIQRYGLFNYHFLSRNLAAMLVLTPRILAKYPYVKVSWHGMSLFLTSPNLAWLRRPRVQSPLSPALWLTVIATALPSLLYQNSGFVQFGYRFSLDYLVFLVILLAIGGRPLTRLFKAALLFAIGVNLFGALIFDRHMQFMYDDGFFPNGNQ